MSDTNDYAREKRKSILRMRMITGKPEETEEDAALYAQLDQDLSRHRHRKILGVMLLAACLAAVVLFIWFYRSHKTYGEYTVLWQQSLEGSSLAEYSGFGNDILRYSRDGAACYNRNGEMIWNQSFEMKKPVIHISGEYAVIADQQGHHLYIFDHSGCTGQVTTNQPMTRVQVASQGVVAVIVENTRSNQILFYDKNGTALDITLKTLIEEYGYPMDIGLSPDGQQLVVAYIYMDAGTMMNRVVFYNFEVGKSRQDRVVGIFMEYQSAMVGEVTFLGNEHACAFADDRVDFYSLTNALSPALTQSVTYDGRTIQSVFHDTTHVGVIVEGDSSDGNRQLYVYNAVGQEQFSCPVAMAYSHAEFSGDYLLLYNDTNIQIYDKRGSQIYRGSLEGTITKCISAGRDKVFQVGGQVLSALKLQ